MPDPSRRELLAATSLALGAGLSACPARAEDAAPAEPFGYCLNTSTVQGQKLTIVEEVELAARAGYNAIEPWVRELDQYAQGGGSLKDLGKRIRDLGLRVPSSIDFFEWIVDDPARRRKGLEAARKSMDLVRQIGGQRIAAPPAGATDQASLDLHEVVRRYGDLLEVGERIGVIPEVELWGFSKTLSGLGEVMLVAIESRHPQACVLPDVYHLYKGGHGFTGLRLVSGTAFHVIHANDYPADPPRATITDAARVYPGDGIAPWKSILRDLRAIGYRGMLSLELFNRDYWKQDAAAVARTGLEKMRALVRSSREETSSPAEKGRTQ